MTCARSMDEELEFPEDIIQHIQSFLECKPAAQTSVLSKSWYNAWSTRPSLFLEDQYFNFNLKDSSDFLDFGKTTIQRYLNFKLKVNKFVLGIISPFTKISHIVSNVDKLIVDALSLEMDKLKLYFPPNNGYLLPAQVFANKYLTDLELCRCKVDHVIPGNVLCSNLRTLSLSSVSIDDRTFKDIIAGCPIIEHLDLYNTFKALNAGELQSLKSLIIGRNGLGSTAIISSFFYGPFLNLGSLVLKYVTIDDLFLTDLSSCFPKLEDLFLEYSNDTPNIQISSDSITRLSLVHRGMLKVANFDLPAIKSFKFSVNRIPLISFTSSNEWKSEIELFGSYHLHMPGLRDLLIDLSQSKISLHLTVYGDNDTIVVPERNIDNIHFPKVEELNYNVVFQNCTEFNFLMEGLLHCRPKMVSLTCSSSLIAIPRLYKKLVEQKNKKGLNISPQDSSVNNLKEVNVEFFEESLKQWIHIKAFLIVLDIPNYGAERLRFKLKWGSVTVPEESIIKFVQKKHPKIQHLGSC